jgi:branched-chain amino acid transport system substrate-binding protein
MGGVLARIAYFKLKARSVVSIPAADCAYCNDLSSAFEKEFLLLGGKVFIFNETLENDRDYSTIIKKIKNISFEAILVPNQELNSARIISSLYTAGFRQPYLGGDGWGNVGEEFFKIISGAKIVGYSVSHWHPDVISVESKRFIESYRNEYKKDPNDTSVLAYDSMMILIESIMRLKKYDRMSLERSLNLMKNYNGITGKFVFHRDAAPTKSIVLLSVSGARFKVSEVIKPLVNL